MTNLTSFFFCHFCFPEILPSHRCFFVKVQLATLLTEELEAMSLSCFNSTLSACSRCSEWQQALQVAWWFMGLIRGWWCDYVWLVVTPRLVNLMAYRSIHDSVSLSRKYIISRGKRMDSTKSAIIFVTKLWSSQKEGSSCWKFIPLLFPRKICISGLGSKNASWHGFFWLIDSILGRYGACRQHFWQHNTAKWFQ